MLGAACPVSAGAAPPVEVLALSCAVCHGTNGVSAGRTTANLAGQPAAYIAAMMQAFKDGDRPATIMDRLARAYDERDFAAIGAFFESQPLARAAQQLDAAKRARGAKLHENLCAECHKDGGRRFDSGGAVGPVLAGQWVDYLVAAIQQYYVRDRDVPTKMGVQLLKLGPGDAEALAHFYASQP